MLRQTPIKAMSLPAIPIPAERGARSFALGTRGAYKATADRGLPGDIVGKGGIALQCNWTFPAAHWGILGV